METPGLTIARSACNLTSIACSTWCLIIIRVKYPDTLSEQLSSRLIGRFALTTTKVKTWEVLLLGLSVCAWVIAFIPSGGLMVSPRKGCIYDPWLLRCSRLDETTWMDSFPQVPYHCWHSQGSQSSKALMLKPRQQQQHGQDNIRGIILDGKSYRQGKATAQTPIVPAVSGVTITSETNLGPSVDS